MYKLIVASCSFVIGIAVAWACWKAAGNPAPAPPPQPEAKAPRLTVQWHEVLIQFTPDIQSEEDIRKATGWDVESARLVSRKTNTYLVIVTSPQASAAEFIIAVVRNGGLLRRDSNQQVILRIEPNTHFRLKKAMSEQ